MTAWTSTPPDTRAGACEPLTFLEVGFDADRNAASPADAVIARADSSIAVVVVQTQEDWMIARGRW